MKILFSKGGKQMKCPKCKNCIPNNCKFCPECGADIRSASISTQSALSSFPRIAKPVEKRKAKSGSELQLNRTPIISKPDDNMREEPRRKDGVQLWAGGPYWADRNLGADNPEDSGYYFLWGGVVGYKRQGNVWVAIDGSSSNFSFTDNTHSSPMWDFQLKKEGWITEDGVLVLNHDAAHRQWGNGWRMPTKQEFEYLRYNCRWRWTKTSALKGYVICGKNDYASSSIFLPCAGMGYETSLGECGVFGYYWSSTSNSRRDEAWNFQFSYGGRSTDSKCRSYGLSIRPVHGLSK